MSGADHVEAAVDFMRRYADRTHHGKEEGILFKELSGRELSAEDQQVMNELVADHVLGRETTAALSDANEQYRDGEGSALTIIVSLFHTLCDFYPKHIEKEDD
jgi:hemerythrin-like domain-containing protein